MNTYYEKPRLTTFGSVENLTGITGNPSVDDFLVINGNAVSSLQSGQTGEDDCLYIQSAPDSFTYVGSLTGQKRADCDTSLQNWDGTDQVPNQ